MSRALLKRQAPTFSTLHTAWRTPAVTEAALGARLRAAPGVPGARKRPLPRQTPLPLGKRSARGSGTAPRAVGVTGHR